MYNRRRRVYLARPELFAFFDPYFAGEPFLFLHWLEDLLDNLSRDEAPRTARQLRSHQLRLR